VKNDSKRLDEIAARIAAATPGSWAWQKDRPRLGEHEFTRLTSDLKGHPGYDDEPKVLGMLGIGRHSCIPDENHVISIGKNDAELIANAPADLALLVRVLRAESERECPECGGEGCEIRTADVDRWGAPCRVRRALDEVAR
jgi:hypothetical protein